METTEKPKRTYQKHKTEYKITVKHYLNKTIKEYDIRGNSVHPFYVQVTYKSRNTRFRSKVKPVLANSVDVEKEADTINSDIAITRDLANSVDVEKEADTINSDIAITRDKAFIISLVNYIELSNAQQDDDENKLDINYLTLLYNDDCFNLVSHVDFLLTNELLDIVRGDSIGDGFSWYYYSNIKPMTYFEFYKEKHPALCSLKEKYSSDIWFLDLYIEQVKHHDNLKHDIFYANEVYFSTVLNYWTPTIQDYKDNFIQKELYNYFDGSQEIVKIIEDLDKLMMIREDLNPYAVR